MPAHAPILNLERGLRMLDAAREGRVLVVGDAMLDRYLSGNAERISPEAPVPVVRVREERTALGGAANVAAGVRALGASCRLVAAIGDDEAGERLLGLLASLGVSGEDLLTVRGRPTTQKTRVIARHQQVLRVDREADAPLDEGAADALRQRALGALEEVDALVLEDYDKGVFTPSLGRALVEAARERDLPVVVDPKLRHFFDFPGAFLFKPNVRELAAALGAESAPSEESALRPLLDRLECEHLLLTLGEQGMLLVSRESGGVHRIPSQARDVYDVTGAGDTVVSVLGAVLAGRPDLPDAAALANLAAGIEVSRLGAVPVTRDELIEELRRRD